MSEKPAFSVERAGTDEKSFRDVFGLLVMLHREEGYVPLSAEKAARNTWHALQEGMTFLARAQDGTAIGVLAMVELGFWYSEETFLQDMGFFVRLDWRGGTVGRDLMRAARDEGNARNKITYVTIHNPDRRPKRTKAAMESQTLGFVPLGYTVKLR